MNDKSKSKSSWINKFYIQEVWPHELDINWSAAIMISLVLYFEIFFDFRIALWCGVVGLCVSAQCLKNFIDSFIPKVYNYLKFFHTIKIVVSLLEIKIQISSLFLSYFFYFLFFSNEKKTSHPYAIKINYNFLIFYCFRKLSVNFLKI